MGLTPDLFRPRPTLHPLSPTRIRSFVVRRTRRALFRNEPKIRRSLRGLPGGLRLNTNLRLDSHVLLGRYESEIAPFVREFCAPGATVYDVGANTGYYTLVAAKLGAARIVAIEPDPAALQILRRVLEANPTLAPSVEVVVAAAGAVESADTTTLDAIAAEPGRVAPDFLMVDVEGFEVDVLRGAARTLRDRMPSVIVETHGEALDRACSDLLEDAGYSPEIVDPRRWFGESRPLLLNRWLIARGRPAAR